MAEPINEPKKGESIRAWAVRVARELTRLAKLLNVDPSSGLEVVGGTLRAVAFSVAGIELVRVGAGGIPVKVGSVPGTATVTLYEWNGTNLTLGTRTATIRNHLPTAWDANRDVWAVRWLGTRWPLVQSCS